MNLGVKKSLLPIDDNRFFSTENIAGIIMSVMLFSIFIIIFFFTYTTYIERLIVQSELKDLSKNFVDIVKLVVENQNKMLEMDTILSSLKNEKHDLSTMKRNKQIRQKAIGFCVGFVVLCCIVIWLLYQKHHFSISKLIFHSTIMLVFIAIVEIVFLNIITRNYQNMDYNRLGRCVVNNMLKFSSIENDSPLTLNPDYWKFLI